MIKFLGHKINMVNEDYDDEPRVFDPKEFGESCLMIGPNKPNYETFLEQASFLRNTYVLMHGDNPEKFYEIIKNNINNQEIISICEKQIENNYKLKLDVKKLLFSFVPRKTQYYIMLVIKITSTNPFFKL